MAFLAGLIIGFLLGIIAVFICLSDTDVDRPI